jgi:hypothetical protein
MEPVMQTTNTAPINTPIEVVYMITGKCGQILDTFTTQSKAVKEFICHYRLHKVEDARLIMIKYGKQYVLNPTGTVADYHN